MLKANFMIGFLVLLPLLSLVETTDPRAEDHTERNDFTVDITDGKEQT